MQDLTDKPTRRPRRAAPPARRIAAFRMRVTEGDRIYVGPGKIRLLEAIGETGSITAAAKSIGMSYRRAWMLVDAVNAALKRPAVRSVLGGEHGGGSELTDTGRTVVEIYRRIEATAARACAADITALLRLLAS